MPSSYSPSCSTEYTCMSEIVIFSQQSAKDPFPQTKGLKDPFPQTKGRSMEWLSYTTIDNTCTM